MKTIQQSASHNTLYQSLLTIQIAGEAGHLTDPTDARGLDTAPIFSQSQPDDFAIGFDDVNPNTSFDLYEKVDVKHGLFISRVGAAKTFFHRVEPSTKVSFHLNPLASDVSKAIEKFHFPISVTTKVSGRVSIFSKFKALIRDKFLVTKSSSYQRSLGNKETATVSELLQIVSLLLTPKEVTGPTTTEQELVKKKAEKVMKPEFGCEGSDAWLVPLSKRSKGISSMFFSGKWAFLTSALAIRTPGCNR